MKNAYRISPQLVVPLLLTVVWHVAAAQGASVPVQVEKITVRENPAGFQVSLWANGRQELMFLDFGRRPFDRVCFHKWDFFEEKKGEYKWGKHFERYQKAHRFGSTVIANVNIISTRKVNPQAAHTIPKCYPPRISDPITRAAAHRFLKAYTRELLTRCGSVILVLDYELFWNYLPRTKERQNEYRDWYVEAAATARATAKELEMSNALRLMPIVNGDPLRNAPKSLNSPAEGHKPAKWLLDVIEASDLLGIDTYSYNPRDPASPAQTLKTVEFWATHYSQGKPVYITEAGLSSLIEYDKSNQARRGYHARGTEAEQAAFLGSLLDTIIERKQKGLAPWTQFRGLSVWMHRDQKFPYKKSALETHFGVVRLDGSRKPAFNAVHQRIAAIESDPKRCPWRETACVDVAEQLHGTGQSVPLTFSTGTDFDFIRCRFTPPNGHKQAVLKLRLKESGTVLARVNAGKWIAVDHQREATVSLADIDQSGENLVQLYFTGAKHPFRQELESVQVLVD